MDALLFWVFAAVDGRWPRCSSSGQRNPMYSVLLLIVSFGALSGLYVLLGAPFVAAIQIIIYAGAIMVLFLFVVMLLNVPTEDPRPGITRGCSAGRAAALRRGAVVLLALELLWALAGSRARACRAMSTRGDSSVHDIGMRLFRDYAFAFEATSVLILVAMVGAIVLARKEPS